MFIVYSNMMTNLRYVLVWLTIEAGLSYPTKDLKITKAGKITTSFIQVYKF